MPRKPIDPSANLLGLYENHITNKQKISNLQSEITDAESKLINAETEYLEVSSKLSEMEKQKLINIQQEIRASRPSQGLNGGLIGVPQSEHRKAANRARNRVTHRYSLQNAYMLPLKQSSNLYKLIYGTTYPATRYTRETSEGGLKRHIAKLKGQLHILKQKNDINSAGAAAASNNLLRFHTTEEELASIFSPATVAAAASSPTGEVSLDEMYGTNLGSAAGSGGGGRELTPLLGGRRRRTHRTLKSRRRTLKSRRK